MTPTPVTPRNVAPTTVTTGGTAVSVPVGPCNGFALQNTQASAALFYNLTGAAATTAGGGTFSLVAGGLLLWDQPLAAGTVLSVNAAASSVAFSCVVW